MKPNKELGQHWLFDHDSLTAVAEGAKVAAGDAVLEIGPGLGTLTRTLLELGAQVTAVEFDSALAADLGRRLGEYTESKQLVIVQEDILKFDLSALSIDYKVAANIPYYLTSNLLRTFCDSANPPELISLLMQKEVAERVAAAPGSMSLLSVTTQLFYEPQLGLVVPAQLFTPPPKVDSQVLILQKRQQPLYPGIDTKKFFSLVKAGFSERRKKLRSSLSGGLHLGVTEVEDVCVRAGIDPNLRAQALSLAQWHQLYEEFSQ